MGCTTQHASIYILKFYAALVALIYYVTQEANHWRSSIIQIRILHPLSIAFADSLLFSPPFFHLFPSSKYQIKIFILRGRFLISHFLFRLTRAYQTRVYAQSFFYYFSTRAGITLSLSCIPHRYASWVYEHMGQRRKKMTFFWNYLMLAGPGSQNLRVQSFLFCFMKTPCICMYFFSFYFEILYKFYEPNYSFHYFCEKLSPVSMTRRKIWIL